MGMMPKRISNAKYPMFPKESDCIPFFSVPNLKVGGNPASTISRHEYTYPPQGNVATRNKEHGANPAAIKSEQSYQYYKACKRTSLGSGGAFTAATFNKANQMTSIHVMEVEVLEVVLDAIDILNA